MSVLEITARGVHRVDAVRPVDEELVQAALDWIDDPVGLHDGRPVAVADLWRAVMSSLVGDSCDSILLVHPDDWPPQRVRRVTAAANVVADDVATLRRGEWRPAASAQIHDTQARDAQAHDSSARTRRRLPVLLVALAAGIAAISVARGAPVAPVPIDESQTVAEGRIEVRVPAGWTVTRVTGGPGSRRLQAGPAGDPDVAVHITQAYAPDAAPVDAASLLGRVIAEQPAGVFVDFHPDGQVGGRPAVTYRELRPPRTVEWAVVQAGSTRVGIGCQGTPQRIGALRATCAQVVSSVRQRGTDPAR